MILRADVLSGHLLDDGDWVMVWIMSLPNGFGEFWPDGDFEDGDNPSAIGWYGRLKEDLKNLSPEEQNQLMPGAGWSRYGYFVSTKFVKEVGEKAAVDLPPITPVLPHEAPTTFNTEKACKNLGDLIMLNDGILAVSEELKAIIEDLEFGVHQFFPIDIIPPRGVCPKKFFTMVIGNYRNSFEDTAKTLPRWSDDGPYKFSSVSKRGRRQ